MSCYQSTHHQKRLYSTASGGVKQLKGSVRAATAHRIGIVTAFLMTTGRHGGHITQRHNKKPHPWGFIFTLLCPFLRLGRQLLSANQHPHPAHNHQLRASR